MALLARVLLLGIIGLIASPAVAQSYIVQPMRVDTAVNAGRQVEVSWQLHNTSANRDQRVLLSLAELTQNPAGHWEVIETGSERVPTHQASALSWIELVDREIDLPAKAAGKATAIVRVPSNVRGVHFAALIAEPPRPEVRQGLTIRTRIIVPLIFRIDGRPVRQRVNLDDIGLLFGPRSDTSGAYTTTAEVQITNAGQTFPRVRSQILVDRLVGERWRPVTRVDVPERGIVPGVTLSLGEDLNRRLPSGTYRLAGHLWVDGRRLGVLEKEIAFEGDPEIDVTAYDTVLTLSPQIVAMPVVPGAARTTVLRVENPGEYPVNVQVAASTPRGLAGAAYGEMTGNEFSAATWTEVRPTEFTLRPFGAQNVRIIGSVPRENATQPNYYADIVLHGTYADGQSAGDTRSTIHLTNTGIESRVEGMIDQLQLAQGSEASDYVVTARLLNTGNVHIRPTLAVQVFGQSVESVAGANLAGEEGPLLPLTTRTFSDEINFSDVEPGDYVLRATARFGAGVAAQELQIAVLDEEIDGETIRSVTVTGGEISVDLPEGVLAPGG